MQASDSHIAGMKQKLQTIEANIFPSIDSLIEDGLSPQEINRMIDNEAELDVIERDETF